MVNTVRTAHNDAMIAPGSAVDDTTMNQFFVVAIAEKISAMETTAFFERRGAVGNKKSADKAWKKVSNRAPFVEDKWQFCCGLRPLIYGFYMPDCHGIFYENYFHVISNEERNLLL